MWVLKNHNDCPPGEFRYEQTLNGILKKFGPSPIIRQVAQTVVDFRKGNQLPGATFEEALQDVDTWNCQRIGNNERWCRSTEQTYAEAQPAVRKPGGCCGASIE